MLSSSQLKRTVPTSSTLVNKAATKGAGTYICQHRAWSDQIKKRDLTLVNPNVFNCGCSITAFPPHTRHKLLLFLRFCRNLFFSFNCQHFFLTVSEMLHPRDSSYLAGEIGLEILPTEIHLQIASYLPYPDALALKHTNGYFYRLIRTDVALKVDWLLERGNLKLPIPGRSYSLRTDEAFCRGEVRKIMERRRWHQECKADCLVVKGSRCPSASLLKLLRRGQAYFFAQRSISVDWQGMIYI